MREYNHLTIEKKWQKEWEKKKLYKAVEKGKKKMYVLDMFPYPSGDGLHVGHPKGYIATDIVSRHARMQGKSVLHPMGWDAFGLPAENFAIKNRVHPRKAVEKNVARFKEQLKLIGLDYDWSREINTTDPAFYKWTQWIFLKLYEKGLAYQSWEPINWCPSCQTGLANEDLEGNACERCGTVVEKRPMRQWVLKITEYAERLLNDLELLPQWQESIKESQRNWIGKSEGAEIDFPITTDDGKKYKYVILHGFQSGPDRPRWKYVKNELEKLGHEVIIPELPNTDSPKEEEQVAAALAATSYDENTVLCGHSLGAVVALKVLEKIDSPIARLVTIGGFVSRNFKDRPRNFDKTFSWEFDGAKIRSNVKSVTILHDPRDYAVSDVMAKELSDLLKTPVTLGQSVEPHFTGDKEPDVLMWLRPAIRVFTTRPDTLFGATFMALAPEHPLVAHSCASQTCTNRSEVESYVKAALAKTEIERQENKEKTGVQLEGVRALNPATGESIPVYVADYILAHYGTGAIMAVPAHDDRDLQFAAKFDLPIKPVIADVGSGTDIFPGITEGKIAIMKDTGHAHLFEGILMNSGEFNGLHSSDAKAKMAEKFGVKKTMYKIRDWVFSRQRYWGEPIPIIHCEQCGAVPVPEKDLPVKLPEVQHYEPTGTGESPLAAIDTWVNVKCPKCKGKAKRETNTMPQWAGSSWYWLRYMDPKNSKKLVDSKKEKYWGPVDLYVGGAEHATRHLIYGRFWHKFLQDIGVVASPEPFTRLISVGLIQAEDGRKMSKRYGNVINPDDIVASYGADTLRVYEMFMGPFTDAIAWKTSSLIGARRFIERVWRLQEKLVAKADASVERELHKTVKKVGEDIAMFKFNTAISQMMIFVNLAESNGITKKQYLSFVSLLAPFAPHVAEELWHTLGNTTSVHVSAWPKFDPKKTLAANVRIAVQINGKVRTEIEVPTDAKNEFVEDEARSAAAKWIEGKGIRKVIVVPNRIVNIVLD